MFQPLIQISEEKIKSMDSFNIGKMYSILEDKIVSWVESGIELLPNLVMAIIVFALFFVVAKIVKNISFRLLNRATENVAVHKLLSSVLSMIVLVVGLLVALEILNLSKAVTSMLAGAGVIGIAIGFAFQESSANFISGFFIAFRQPYRVGDIIKSESIMGIVDRINMRSTVIRTFDGQDVLIPNRTVFTNPIWNYSNTGQRRIVLEVGVGYEEDLDKVEKVAQEALEDVKDRDKNEPLNFYYEEFGGSSINFRIQYWIQYPDGGDFLASRHDAVKKIKKAFDQADINIPFPIRTLDMSDKLMEKIGGMAQNQASDSSNE
jgi:small conductance mechanosensitive channel